MSWGKRLNLLWSSPPPMAATARRWVSKDAHQSESSGESQTRSFSRGKATQSEELLQPSDPTHARFGSWGWGERFGAETEAVVDGCTSSQPRAWEERTRRPDPVSLPRPLAHPSPAAPRPRARHCCARGCEGPTLRPRGRNGGRPEPGSSPRGPALYGKAVPS